METSTGNSESGRDYPAVQWDHDLIADSEILIHQAIREDLEHQVDWTTLALVDDDAQAAARIVARRAGTLAGLRLVERILTVTGADLAFEAQRADAQHVAAGESIGLLSGNARDLLTLERTILNFLARLAGIATLTAQYVAQVQHTNARIYDTRKTTPGWRRLEKYAVGCGGGHNHRLGLYAGVMIKDNHLAFWSSQNAQPATAVQEVRRLLASAQPAGPDHAPLLVEVEVDTLDQLERVLDARPDLILLDNMTLDQLTAAVAMRDERGPQIELEASGGVNLQSVADIAATGVDRISVGAITHSAVALDLALDWQGEA